MRRMRIVRILILASLGCLAAAPAQTAAPAPAKNVVIVTIDGFRWQEVFTGADQAYFKKSSDGKPTDAERRFWRDEAAARRETLMPFFWRTIAKEGVIFGDPSRQSLVHLTNGLW